MLGILPDGGPAARLLESHGMTLETTQAAVAAKVADEDRPPPGDTTDLTPPAMVAIHRASVEARRRHIANIAPMQLLLALVDSAIAPESLGLSVDITAVRDEVRSQLES